MLLLRCLRATKHAGSACPDLIAVPPKEQRKEIYAHVTQGMAYIKTNIKRAGDFVYAIECKVAKYMRAHELDIMLALYREHGVIPVRAWPKDGKVCLEYIMYPEELTMFREDAAQR